MARRSHVSAFALVVFYTSLCVPAVLADTVTLNPTKDNTLYEPIAQDGFADRSDGAGPTMFTGRTSNADADPGPGTRAAVRRGVLAFNIAGNIPAGATIDSVQLILYCDKVKLTTAFSTSLHQLESDWGEGTSNTGNSQQGRGEPPTTGDATWNHTFYPSQFWTTPGGDYASTTSASRTVGNTGFYTWGSTSGMVSDVQFWLDNPSQNYGWIVLGTESQTETAKRFATRENTGSSGGTPVKPRLIVNYTPQTVTGACCQGSTCSVVTPAVCTSLPGVYQGNGTTCSPNPCVIVTGACCASNGTCSEVTQSSCTGSGGSYQGDGSACATAECSIQLTPFIDPLPLPGVAVPTSGAPGATAMYDITMLELEQQLHSELPGPTRVWGYNDGVAAPGYPGPIIEARTGQPVTVNWINDIRDFDTGVPRTNDHYLDVDVQTDPNTGMTCIHGAEDAAKTVVHLHGGHVPAASDGYPEATALPGDPPQTYVYPNNQQASYLWFHDHALGITRLNVIMGLAGLYLLRDPVEDAINLPQGGYEIPLVIQDRKFNPDGSLYYPSMWMEHFFGDKVLVNGKVWPYFDVDKGKYRFRLLNGSTSRTYTLSLDPPSGILTFTVIGTEGGLLEAPAYGVGQLTMGPGERYDVVVDFAGYGTGDDIFLVNSAGAPFPNGPVDLTQVMKFTVRASAGDTDPLPATLRPVVPIDPNDAVMTRDFRLKLSGTDGCGRSVWQINGMHWDDIMEYPQLGTTEIWRFINASGVSHPMHLHLVSFQILDRDGFTTDPNGTIVPDGNPQPPAAEEAGWKDTAMVGPGQILRIIARFEDYKGKYAYHCHILEHEDHEMMRQFQTVACGDAEIDVPAETCDDGGLGSYDGCSARCRIEEFIELGGVATGGSTVDATISGEVVSIATTAGQTAAQAALALAAQINANTSLLLLGVSATAIGNRVVVEEGDVTDVQVNDLGLVATMSLIADSDGLWWSSVTAPGGYDVVRGNLARLKATAGDYSDPTVTVACPADNHTSTYLGLAETLAPGEGRWYLVRPRPAGSYDDGDPSQSGSRDPEIALSGNGCP